jgi:agmatine deiminase
MSARAGRPYLPPEWAPQSGVMLTWPHAQSDWAAALDAVEAVYIAIAREISAHERVLIACHNEDHKTAVERQLATAGTDMQRIALHVAASNDTWARDHGPITVSIDNGQRLLDFRFNGWGGKYAHALDNTITQRLHAADAFGPTPIQAIDLVLEGGSIEVDGEGTLLTTTRSLLAANRNPGLAQGELENRLRQWLGVERILWLQHGGIPGDDTDGHIDTLARFCDAHTIAYVTSEQPQDPWHAELKAMARELESFRSAAGEPYRLVPLPSPAPIHDSRGERLPATYANFAIINDAVLVPTYDDASDQEACARLASCFPGRKLVPVDARALIQQYGSVHCALMQLPAGVLA